MGVPYEESVILRLQLGEYKQQVSEAINVARKVKKELKDIFSNIENINLSEIAQGLNSVDRVDKERLKSIKAYGNAAFKVFKEIEAEEIAGIKRKSTEALNQFKIIKENEAKLIKINSEIAAQYSRSSAKEDLANSAAVDAKVKAHQRENIAAAKTLSKESESLARARATEDLIIAKELHRYRLGALREEYEISKSLQQYRNSSTKSGVNFTLPQAARVGAGAAVATGNYQLGGGLYAVANMLNSSGLSATSLNLSAAAATSLGAALVGVAGAVGILFHGKGFNEELAKMSTLLADASTPANEFKDILDKTAISAINISNKFNLDLIDVVKAFKDALSSGIDARDLERFTNVSATLSTSLGVGLSESTNILTTFKDTYQLTISELSKTNDYLFNSVDVGKVTVTDMVKNLGRLVPVAHQAGLSIKEIFVGVDVLTREGQSTSTAITSMTQFITAMVSPTEKSAKKFTELGIAWGDAAFEGKKVADIFKELKEKTGGSSSLLGELFPEIRAKRGAAGGIQSIGGLLDEVSAGLDKTGTAATASARSMDTLWTNLGKVTTEMSNFLAKGGSDFANGLNKIFFSGTVDREQNESNFISRIKDRAAAGKSKKDISKELLPEYTSEYGSSGILGAYDKRKFDRLLDEGIKAWEVAGRDSGKAYSNSLQEEMSKLESSISKTLEKVTGTLPEYKRSRAEKKVINNVLTSDEKDKIDDIELEIQDLKELLEVKKQLIVIEAEKQGAKLKDQVSNSKNILDKAIADPNSTPDFIKFAQEALEKFEKRYKDFVGNVNNDLKNISGGEEIMAAIDEKILQLEKIRDTALNDPYRHGATDYNIEAAAYAEEVKKQEEVSRKEKEKSSKHWISLFEKAAKDIADADLREFKRTQEEKKHLLNSEVAGMLKENNRDKRTRDEVYDKTFQSKVSGPDIDRNRRAAMEEKDLIKGQMEAAIAGGATQSVFDELAKRLQNAIEAIANNTYDKDRAGKILRGNEGELGDLNSAYHNKYVNQYQSNVDTINRTHPGISKSADQIRNEAARKADKEVQVEKVRLDAVIKLSVDGTVSKETLDMITNEVLSKIHSSIDGKNGQSAYDRPTRNGNDFSNNGDGYSYSNNDPYSKDDADY